MDISKIEVLRATEPWQQAGAYSVRIQGLARQFHIALSDEFDGHDGAGTRYIVLLDDGYPIATCRMYEVGDDVYSIGRVVVLEEYRGHGLGRKTIIEAEKWLRELGARAIELDSRVTAVGFYEKLGYRVVDGTVIHGTVFDCIRMEKSLSAGSPDKQYDIICIGMALVDSIIKGFDPEPISASGFRAASGTLSVGGEAVNEAMAAAKLGMKTGVLCALGEDSAGDMVAAALEKCGADTSLIVRCAEHPTPVTTMFVDADGTRKSITNSSHRYNFHPEQYAERFTGAKAVILGSLFRAPFDDPEIIYSVVRAAKAAGTLVIADTKLPNFRFLTLDDIAQALPLIDCITPNEDEAKYYSGETEPSLMADAFLKRGVKSVIIKLGGKGCFYKDAERSYMLPACKINAVDATGAGDNFVAGFASELLRGADVDSALRFANACGAICTTAVGAGTALRSREQVLEVMHNCPSPPIDNTRQN